MSSTVQAKKIQKRTQLSLEQKRDIASRLEKATDNRSAVMRNIASEFNIHQSSVWRIKRNAAKISNFNAQYQNKTRKRMKKPTFEELDSNLHSWFLQQRAQGIAVSGKLLIEQAMLMNKEQANFKGSQGWLQKFNERHNIRQLSFHGESADEEAATIFIGEIEDFIREGDYDLRDVYNMDESGLCWKSLPKKTLAYAGETRADKGKVSKERVTIAVCANATGTHRLPLLLIGKFQNPRCFKNVTNLPVTYMAQSSARISSFLFTKWVKECFKPAVELRQTQERRSGEVLLLVDNCAAHKIDGVPCVDSTWKMGNILVKFLPPNTTSLIQPMNQGVIIKLKRLFQIKLLRRIIQFSDGLQKFYKIYDLKNCIDMVAASWKQLTEENLKKAWTKLLPTALKHDERQPVNLSLHLLRKRKS